MPPALSRHQPCERGMLSISSPTIKEAGLDLIHRDS
jgi:hypothetical protein